MEVIDVWDSNVEAEMTRMRKQMDKFPYIAMVSEAFCVVCGP